MTVSNMILCLGLFAACLASATAFDPCPFNEQECQCINDTRKPPKYDFGAVICKSDSLWMPVTFNAPYGTKYAVNSFHISGDVANLPANYLKAFKSIETLELADWGPRTQAWDPLAFNGVTVSTLIVSDLDGVLPAGPGLSLLGANGLKQLHVISEFWGSVKLVDHQFDKFKNLTALSISQMPITEIGEFAFSGLEKSLTSLTLSNTSYHNSSADRHLLKAVAKLPNLVDLTLDGTGIARIPGGYFSAFPKLSMLQLSYDNLSDSTDTGALYDLPSNLWLVTLRQIGLSRVPRMVYAQDQGILGAWLDVRGNPIEALVGEEFRGNTIYQRVALKDTKLVFLDLSSIANLGKGITFDFGDNKYLKFLTASSLEEVPRDAKVSINPALEIIDPSLANVFARYPKFSLDLSNNLNLECENLAWITPYVSCFKRVDVTGALCSSGQTVSDYLNNIGFKCNPV